MKKAGTPPAESSTPTHPAFNVLDFNKVVDNWQLQNPINVAEPSAMCNSLRAAQEVTLGYESTSVSLFLSVKCWRRVCSQFWRAAQIAV